MVTVAAKAHNILQNTRTGIECRLDIVLPLGIPTVISNQIEKSKKIFDASLCNGAKYKQTKLSIKIYLIHMNQTLYTEITRTEQYK
jgi:hypothetical protein